MDLIVVRTPTEEQEWLAVHNSAVAARNWSAAGLGSLLARSGAHRQVLALDGGWPAGAALAVVTDACVTAWISVVPTQRGLGIGSFLWQDVKAWAVAAAASAIETRVEAADGPSVTFARARGLAVVREEARLVLDLAAAAHSRAEPRLRLVSLGEDVGLIDGVYGVFSRVQELARAITRDAWREQMLAAEAAGIQRTTVALSHGTVVGYAMLALLPARPDVASHSGTFVHPDFKRIGVARALKAEQIAWARAAGFARLEASSDPGNVAKMRLYASFGYRKTPGWYVMQMSI